MLSLVPPYFNPLRLARLTTVLFVYVIFYKASLQLDSRSVSYVRLAEELGLPK